MARTLTELYFGALERFGTRPVAFRAKRDGQWLELSYEQLADRVQDLSLGLLDLGVTPGDRVAILSENRPEWAIADYACLAARCTDVPIYPTLPARQVEYTLCDSGAVAMFVSTRHQMEKVAAIRPRVPGLRHVISFDNGANGSDILTLEQVMARGRAARSRHPRWKDAALEAKP
jgi:long-chain acyl-CoA synthetase